MAITASSLPPRIIPTRTPTCSISGKKKKCKVWLNPTFPSNYSPVFCSSLPKNLRDFYSVNRCFLSSHYFLGSNTSRLPPTPTSLNRGLKEFKYSKATFGFDLISQQHLIIVYYSILFEAFSSFGFSAHSQFSYLPASLFQFPVLVPPRLPDF